MDASPLLRLPDELLLAAFEHVVQDKDKDEDEMLDLLGPLAMPPPAYLLISKRLNRILTPRWYRKINLFCKGDRVYSLLLSRPSATPLVHELDVSFAIESVHTCLWTLSQFVALRRLAITIFDSENEYTYEPDDESPPLAEVGESLAALFKRLPHLVDFPIDAETHPASRCWALTWDLASLTGRSADFRWRRVCSRSRTFGTSSCNTFPFTYTANFLSRCFRSRNSKRSLSPASCASTLRPACVGSMTSM